MTSTDTRTRSDVLDRLCDHYKTGVRRALSRALGLERTATSPTVRHSAWAYVRDEVAWSIAYDAAHGRDVNPNETSAWLRIGDRLNAVADQLRAAVERDALATWDATRPRGFGPCDA